MNLKVCFYVPAIQELGYDLQNKYRVVQLAILLKYTTGELNRSLLSFSNK